MLFRKNDLHAQQTSQTETGPGSANGCPGLFAGYGIGRLWRLAVPVTIRSMRDADIPAGMHLCRLSGWNQLEEDWRVFVSSPNGSGRLAECDGEVVGTVTFLRYAHSFSWLSMMLVHPDARRAGVGSRLMDAALDALANETCVYLDATPIGEPLYRKFGFQAECEVVRLKMTVPSGRPASVPEDLCPMGPADFDGVFDLDRRVFGADRSAVLLSFYDRAPDLAMTIYRGGKLRGYCFGRSGYLFRQLGPVVADDAAVAQDLVAGGLAGRQGKVLAVDAPLSAPEWIAWLHSLGFTAERPFRRMYRGERQCSSLADRAFAVAGPEFG